MGEAGDSRRQCLFVKQILTASKPMLEYTFELSAEWLCRVQHKERVSGHPGSYSLID